MGVEIVSNTGGVYNNEIPREVQKVNTKVVTENIMDESGTQRISESETKAAKSSEKNKKNENQNNEQKEKKLMSDVVDEANKKMKLLKTNCEFKYHEKTKRVSIKVKDEETGDVIREIPPEETLDMISKMWEMAGLFVDDRR